MSLFVPRRVDTPELLDEHDAPYDDMIQSLVDLRRFNALAGGVLAYRRLLSRFISRSSARPATILDLGTGSSDLLSSVIDRGLRGFGLDLKFDHLLYGKREVDKRGIFRVAGDAFNLPLRQNAIDIVTSSHFFHHFSPDENRRMLAESLRVARLGVIITDTRRNLFPLLFVHLLGALRIVGRITRFDAPASVLRGYTLEEVREVVRGMDDVSVEVRRVAPFRWALLIWKQRAKQT